MLKSIDKQLKIANKLKVVELRNNAMSMHREDRELFMDEISDVLED